MPRVPMIDALFAAHAVRRLRETGMQTDGLFHNIGVDRAALEDRDGRIPFRAHVAIMEQAAALSGDDCFGLHMGAQYETDARGVLAYVAMASATVRDAVRNVARYQHVETDGEELELQVQGDTAVLVNRITAASVGPARQHNEWVVLGTLTALWAAIGRRSSPLWAQFDHAEPASSAEHRRLFGAPVRFAEPVCALALPARILDEPVVSADGNLLHILENYIAALLEHRGTDDDLLHQVERVTLRRLPKGTPRIDAVARELGMSGRTLTRRLGERKVTFSELLDDMRRGLAQRHLADRSLRLSQIAYLLGYSSVSAFTHAYRRWTGHAPSEDRRKDAPAA